MLKLPSSAAATAEERTTGAIAFGFDRRARPAAGVAGGADAGGADADDGSAQDAAAAAQRRTQFYGDDRRAQLERIQRACCVVGVELAVLIKSLRRTLLEANDVTTMHVAAHAALTEEIERVVEADVSGAEV
jgi:hypothetical protein